MPLPVSSKTLFPTGQVGQQFIRDTDTSRCYVQPLVHFLPNIWLSTGLQPQGSYTNGHQPAEHIINSQNKGFPRPDYSDTLHDTIGCELSQYNRHICRGLD